MEGAYVWVMVHYLPASLRGLMLVGFAAAYMSTIGTHLNLGASYLINDLYRRFMAPHRSDKHYVAASRWATIFVAVLSALATWYMETHGASIAAAWKFLLAMGAGAGLVFILRWYWWRINAWSEIAAMIAAATISLTLQSRFGLPVVNTLHGVDPSLPLSPLNSDDPHGFAWLMLLTTDLTTLCWLTVTMATRPEPEEKLRSFYERVRPAALGWRRFASASELEPRAARVERVSLDGVAAQESQIPSTSLRTGSDCSGKSSASAEDDTVCGGCRATGFMQRESVGSIVNWHRRTQRTYSFPGGFNDARQADLPTLPGSGLHLVGGSGCRRMQELNASGPNKYK